MWIGGCPLKDKFRRLYELDTNKESMVVEKISGKSGVGGESGVGEDRRGERRKDNSNS